MNHEKTRLTIRFSLVKLLPRNFENIFFNSNFKPQTLMFPYKIAWSTIEKRFGAKKTSDIK